MVLWKVIRECDVSTFQEWVPGKSGLFGRGIYNSRVDRELSEPIQNDMVKKIILVSGPRQSGKTTLAKSLLSSFDYFNYDDVKDRLALNERSWDRSKPLGIFDELHKMRNWKLYLKGIFDTEGIPPSIVVTGSARMEAFRKVGDSLAGLFLHFASIRSTSGKYPEMYSLRKPCRGF